MGQIFAVPQMIQGDSDIADHGVYGWTLTWNNIGNSDTPMPVSAYAGYADKSFHVEGTFGGAVVNCVGSNDGTNFHPLNDPTGTTIALTSQGVKEVLEHTRYFMPQLSGGSGSSITVTMFVRKTQSK